MEQRTETESRREHTAPAAGDMVKVTMIQYVNRETNTTPTDKRGACGPRDEWTTPQRPDAAGLLWQMGRRVRMPAQWNTVRIHIAGTAGSIRVATRWYATLLMRQEVETVRNDAARAAGINAEA